MSQADLSSKLTWNAFQHRSHRDSQGGRIPKQISLRTQFVKLTRDFAVVRPEICLSPGVCKFNTWSEASNQSQTKVPVSWLQLYRICRLYLCAWNAKRVAEAACSCTEALNITIHKTASLIRNSVFCLSLCCEPLARQDRVKLSFRPCACAEACVVYKRVVRVDASVGCTYPL